MSTTATALFIIAALAQNQATELTQIDPTSTKLTVEQAVQIAQLNAFGLRIAQQDVAEAKALERISRAQLGPGAQLTAGSTWSRVELSGQQGGTSSSTSSTVQFAVSQIIDISGVFTNRIRSAEFNRLSREAGVAATWNTIQNSVRTAYFQALQAEQLVVVQNTALSAAKERLDKANIRVREGAIPRFDALRIETEVARLEQEVIRAQGTARLAKQNLNLAMSRPIEAEVELTQVLDPATLDAEAAALVTAALATRPELKQAELGIKALEQARIADERAGRPSLSLQGVYSQTVNPTGFSPKSNASIGASLTIPIVTSGLIDANAATARAREERAKVLLEQAQLSVALEVRAALTQWETSLAEYKTALKNQELAREALRLANLRYDEQQGILLDVIVSQADLTAAESGVVNARTQLHIAYAALQKAVGRDNLSTDAASAPTSPATLEQGK